MVIWFVLFVWLIWFIWLVSAKQTKQTKQTMYKHGLEAPSGVEPLHRSFADCSLNHLGTAPHEVAIIVSSFSLTQHRASQSPGYPSKKNKE
jgi:hypothetical protein